MGKRKTKAAASTDPLEVIAEDLRPLALAIDSMQLDPANANRHDDASVSAIAASLAEFGQLKPIVVNVETGLIVAGNGTWEAARRLGWSMIAAVRVRQDAGAHVGYAIADNRTAQLAEWDNVRLVEAITQIHEDTPDLYEALRLADLVQPEPGDIVEDEAPPPPSNPITKAGDLWILGDHRLLCGDSTRSEYVARVLGDRKPLIMVTDPPYGVKYDPNWRNEAGISNTQRVGKVSNDDRASWASAYAHFPGAVAYVWHAGKYASIVDRSLTACGFEIRSQIIWVKTRFALSRGQYHWRHEPCWFAVRKQASAKWNGGRKQQTVWSDIVDSWAPHAPMFAGPVTEDTLVAFDASMTTVWEIAGNDGTGETIHGTQKPVGCMARPIQNHGGKEDDVYDPFLGSGTTLIAAEQLGRRCCGIELDTRYCDVIVQRWENFTGRKAEHVPAGGEPKSKRKRSA